MMSEAAVGQATPNAQYLGHRLVYDREPEPTFDPLGNSRLERQYFVNAVIYFATYYCCGWITFIALMIMAFAGLGFRAAFTLWFIGAAVFGILFACLFWLVPVPAQISEWKFFVDGKATVAPVAFEHVAYALSLRQTPLDSVQVRRLNLPGGEARDYLEVRRGLFSGMIACFSYGQDLYLGWTFWLRVSPLRYLLMFFARIWQTLTQRGSDLYVKHRYDYARAMREAMHSAAREGVDVAVGQLHAQGQGIASSLQVAVVDVPV